MIAFDDAAKILDAAVETLPKEIFEKLNGGVNLLPARKNDSDGLLVMGMYFVGQMGRHIEIYYGSFSQAYPDASEEKVKTELIKTLKHELTHHIENLAWDRSLEIWDVKHKAELLAELYGEPLKADSVLFVCDDNAGLSAIAEGLFNRAAVKNCPHVICASAGIDDIIPEQINESAVKAASGYGVDISGHVPRRVSPELLDRFDAVLCMTQEQAEELALQYPAYEAKIMTLGPKNIVPPILGTKGGWTRASDKIADELVYLMRELRDEEAEDAD